MPFSVTFDHSLGENRFDTITNINAFLRKGDLYKQNKKTKKNELVNEAADAVFVMNPIQGKDDQYEITVFDERYKGAPPIHHISMEKI